MDILTLILATVAGAVGASLLACLPGLHIYNIMGLLVMGVSGFAGCGRTLPPDVVVCFSMGLLVGYSMLNTIPSVLLAAPDESALFTVLPGQKFLMMGRGYEGAMITAAGGLAGLVVLLVVVGPVAPIVLPTLRNVFRAHTHWILWCVITFMLMSEWPKGGSRGQAGWRLFLDGWKTTGMGLFTFLLSGLLGFVIFYRSPIPVEVAFQNIMPAFVGLFTLPWLLLNIVAGTEPPRQIPWNRQRLRLDPGAFAQGTFAGALGGGFAAFFPVVTGGVGGLLAGHATALRNDRVFLVSQGASKLIYYVGGFLLFFVPGANLTRGGGAWMVRTLVTPRTTHDYLVALAAMAIAGAVAFGMMSPLTRGTLALMTRFGYRKISVIALGVVLALVYSVTGWSGLGVMSVAGGIGLIPVLFGSRRMNCLGVILLPMACNMSGVGPTVARWLGLI